MTTNPKLNLLHQLKALFNRDEWLYIFAGFMAGLLALPFFVIIRIDAIVLLQEFVPEAAGILFTVFVVDRIYHRREAIREEQREQERREYEKQQEKGYLIRDLGSSVNDIAKHAAKELESSNWLRDGTLHDVVLSSADLSNAILVGADMCGAKLEAVKLQNTNFIFAQLQNSYLSRICAQQANFESAYLQKAHIFHSNLQSASFKFANLQQSGIVSCKLNGANFEYADLTNASLHNVVFDETTILPDGTNWTPETDMSRFTDPSHPDFWRSDDP